MKERKEGRMNDKKTKQNKWKGEKKEGGDNA